MYAAAVALLQWQDTKLHARVAAVSGSQTASLSKGQSNMQQQQQQQQQQPQQQSKMYTQRTLQELFYFLLSAF
jgi:hypothetical protein